MPAAVHETTNAVTGEITRVVVAWTKDALRDHLASARYDREVTTLTVDGLPVSTERGNERTTWLQLMTRAAADSSFSMRKKMAGQFYTLTAAQIIRCGSVGVQYIAACFSVEDLLLTQIEAAETPEDLDAIAETIDAESTWPTKVYT
jgi:hypothetical protein